MKEDNGGSMNDCLLIIIVYAPLIIYGVCGCLAVCYFDANYKRIDRLVFYIAVLCPLWNCYFALKFLIPYLKTLNLREWLKCNFSFKK